MSVQEGNPAIVLGIQAAGQHIGKKEKKPNVEISIEMAHGSKKIGFWSAVKFQLFKYLRKSSTSILNFKYPLGVIFFGGWAMEWMDLSNGIADPKPFRSYLSAIYYVCPETKNLKR